MISNESLSVCVREPGNLGLLGLPAQNHVAKVPELEKGIFTNLTSTTSALAPKAL